MTRLLDARTSQNASFEESIEIPFTSLEPVLFGQVGLNVVNPGGIIRVQFSASVTIEFPAESSGAGILVQIIRGTDPSDDLVYSSLWAEGPTGTDITRVITVAGTDYNVDAPPTNQLIYTAFVSSSSLQPIRIGSESFYATAFCDF